MALERPPQERAFHCTPNRYHIKPALFARAAGLRVTRRVDNGTKHFVSFAANAPIDAMPALSTIVGREGDRRPEDCGKGGRGRRDGV